MTEFLIFVVIGILVYMMCEWKKEKKGEKEVSYRKVIPQFLDKNCEIMVKNPMLDIDVIYSIRGILLDVDEEWVMVEQREKKKVCVKIMRIENIGGVKEIVEN